MKFSSQAFTFIAALALSSAAFGGTVRINTNSYSNGTSGGSYSLKILTGAEDNSDYNSKAKLSTTTFESFCLEPGEYFSNNGVYDYSLSNIVYGGGRDIHSPGLGDPLSVGTAWLYSQFAQGALTGFNYANTSAGRKASNKALQKAFWYLEDETAGEQNYFTNLVKTKFGSLANAQLDATAGAYGVWALNLTSSKTYKKVTTVTQHQSQLYYAGPVYIPVPDTGTTMGLLGLALAGCVAFRRRFSSTK